ncbi:hypothetical protein ID875_30385 [Streptomyces globisporus]|uniref:Uncharacterized protein n=1 Tax=Streptomyces globisporus TaxID=1908 RepID=A0A927GPF7_STRGL|nr:hypothetical protein [Streptomyces globisporus]
MELLARKNRLFDAYARRSDLAETTPDAVDVSDAALARRIVEEEQQRMAGAPKGADPAPGTNPAPGANPAPDSAPAPRGDPDRA